MHLARLVQSGIVKKNARRTINGGPGWVLIHPELRVRTAQEVAGESHLCHKASIRGEPRDEEVGIEDVLELLAEYEEKFGHLTTSRLASSLSITARHARDLGDELVGRGVAEKRVADRGGADMDWLSDDCSAADVAELLGHTEPNPLIKVFEEPERPQPRLDREREDGMQISAGGLCESGTGLQYNWLAHNTLRGAAGASVLNAELLAEQGYL